MDVTNAQVTQFLSGLAAKEFKWGEFDCANFFSDCMHFLTGFDYSAIIEGKWSNSRQALKFFSELSFVDFIAVELDTLEVTLNACKSGDLCIFHCGPMHTVGMVYDNTVASVVEHVGLTYTPLTEIAEDIIKIIRVRNG
jgi:hypothetical protein